MRATSQLNFIVQLRRDNQQSTRAAESRWSSRSFHTSAGLEKKEGKLNSLSSVSNKLVSRASHSRFKTYVCNINSSDDLSTMSCWFPYGKSFKLQQRRLNVQLNSGGIPDSWAEIRAAGFYLFKSRSDLYYNCLDQTCWIKLVLTCARFFQSALNGWIYRHPPLSLSFFLFLLPPAATTIAAVTTVSNSSSSIQQEEGGGRGGGGTEKK